MIICDTGPIFAEVAFLESVANGSFDLVEIATLDHRHTRVVHANHVEAFTLLAELVSSTCRSSVV